MGGLIVQVFITNLCNMYKTTNNYFTFLEWRWQGTRCAMPDLSTRSDITPGQEILLNFTSCSCCTILHKLYNNKQKNTSRILLWSIYAYLTINVFNINFSLLRREKFSKVYFNVEKWSGQNIVWSGCGWFIGSKQYIDQYKCAIGQVQANNGCYHSYNTKSDIQEMIVVKLCFELKNLESTKVVQCWK